MSWRSVRAFALVAVWAAACLGFAEAAVWYVHPSGNDSANGTLSTPLATIEEAIANRASLNGDTIVLFDGLHRISSAITVPLRMNVTIAAAVRPTNCLARGSATALISVDLNVTAGFIINGGTGAQVTFSGVAFVSCSEHCVRSGVREAGAVLIFECSVLSNSPLAVAAVGTTVVTKNSLAHSNANIAANIPAGSESTILVDGSAFHIRGGAWVCDDSLFENNTNLRGTNGGAVVAQDAAIRLTRCTFKENTAAIDAAAVQLEPHVQDVLVEHCRFEDNVAGRSGTLRLLGMGDYTTYIVNTTFHRNRGTQNGGLSISSANYFVIGCTFTENIGTERGAGVSIIEISRPIRGVIKGCVFIRNQAGFGGGGGIYALALQTSLLYIDSCSFTENHANASGGAVRADGGATQIHRSQFRNNTSTGSGGAWASVLSLFAMPVLINSSTFTDDSAAFEGGAVFLSDEEAAYNPPVYMTHVTITGAHAKYGGGLSLRTAYAVIQDLTITNSSAELDGGAIYIAGTRHGRCVDLNTIPFTRSTVFGIPGSSAPFVPPLSFTYNSAGRSGGAVAIDGTAPECPALFEGSAFGASSSAGVTIKSNSVGAFGPRFASAPVRVSIVSVSEGSRSGKQGKYCQDDTFDLSVELLDYFGLRVVDPIARGTLNSAKIGLVSKGDQPLSNLAMNLSTGRFTFSQVQFAEDSCDIDRDPDNPCLNVSMNFAVSVASGSTGSSTCNNVPGTSSGLATEEEGFVVLEASLVLQTDFCPDFQTFSDAGGILVALVATMLAAAIAISTLGTVFWVRSDLIRRSSVPFLTSVLIGSVFIFTFMLMSAGEVTELGTCASRDFTRILGISLLLLAVMVRARMLLMRLSSQHRQELRRSYRRRQIAAKTPASNNNSLLPDELFVGEDEADDDDDYDRSNDVIGEPLGAPETEAVRLLCTQAFVVFGIGIVIVILSHSLDNGVIRGGACHVKSQGMFFLAVTYLILLEVLAVVVVYSAVRKANGFYYEAKWLGAAVFLSVFASAALLVSRFIGWSEGTLAIIYALAIGLATLGTVIFIFSPKFYLLISKQTDRAFELPDKDVEIRRIRFKDLELDEVPLAAGSFGVVFKGFFLGNLCVSKMLRTPDRESINGTVSGTNNGTASGTSTSGTSLRTRYSKLRKKKTVGSREWEMEQAKERVNEFLLEAKQLSRIPQYTSLVSFFGMSRDPLGNLYLVSEMIEGGSLAEYLGDDSFKIGDRDLVNIATNVAGGMSVLHSARTLHLDLASRNLLVFKQHPLGVKICDFGLSVTLTGSDLKQGGVSSMGRVYSARWYEPPEVHEDRLFTKASDVYAYGSCLWEIEARSRPWGSLSTKKAERNIRKGQLMKLPHVRAPATKATTKALYKLARRCWNPKRQERPSFDDILTNTLAELKAKVQQSQHFEEKTRSSNSHSIKVPGVEVAKDLAGFSGEYVDHTALKNKNASPMGGVYNRTPSHVSIDISEVSGAKSSTPVIASSESENNSSESESAEVSVSESLSVDSFSATTPSLLTGEYARTPANTRKSKNGQDSNADKGSSSSDSASKEVDSKDKVIQNTESKASAFKGTYQSDLDEETSCSTSTATS